MASVMVGSQGVPASEVPSGPELLAPPWAAGSALPLPFLLGRGGGGGGGVPHHGGAEKGAGGPADSTDEREAQSQLQQTLRPGPQLPTQPMAAAPTAPPCQACAPPATTATYVRKGHAGPDGATECGMNRNFPRAGGVLNRAWHRSSTTYAFVKSLLDLVSYTCRSRNLSMCTRTHTHTHTHTQSGRALLQGRLQAGTRRSGAYSEDRSRIGYLTCPAGTWPQAQTNPTSNLTSPV